MSKTLTVVLDCTLTVGTKPGKAPDDAKSGLGWKAPETEVFEPGAEVELPEHEALALVRAEVAHLPEGKRGRTQPEPNDAERIASVKATIEGLDSDNGDLWTRTGAPKVAAVREASDLDPPATGQEVAAAYAELALEDE